MHPCQIFVLNGNIHVEGTLHGMVRIHIFEFCLEISDNMGAPLFFSAPKAAAPGNVGAESAYPQSADEAIRSSSDNSKGVSPIFTNPR